MSDKENLSLEKWDGKTKGSLWGYRFFVACIRFFGIPVAYFFCYFVAGYFVLFASKQRNSLVRFYTQGFNYSKRKAFGMAYRNFFFFGQTLIDRIALTTSRRNYFTHDFDNEKVLREMAAQQKGGILLSGHVGNWENAGNLIRERITSHINVVMLDAEAEKIKAYLSEQTGGASYQIIPIKNDMSHLILIHAALKRNEFVAIHSDRVFESSKTILLPFLNKTAHFPIGPFVLARMFNVPITFVYAAKTNKRHYALSATDPIINPESEDQIARAYVAHLEGMVKKYPNQWFNFFDYFAT